MRPGILLDTGPLVAYLYRSDGHHEWAVETFRTLDPPAITCEPVLTETCFLVARSRQPASRVLDYISQAGIRMAFHLDEELDAVRSLMERYANVPMSLADACLVRAAELTGLPICTLDADFAIYRSRGRHPLSLVTPQRRHLHEP